MSVTLYKSQVLTKNDLNIYILEPNGTYIDPFSITYTIYRASSSTNQTSHLCNQECGEEPVLETIDTIPIPFGIGKYFAAWKQANDLDIGSYRIHWHVRRFSDSPIYEEIEEFQVINKIDKLNYSALNDGALLPHNLYGNQNLCAG